MSKADDELEEITKKYIMKLLELQETKLKCINLGLNQSETIKVELSLIKKAKELVNKN